MPSVKAEEGVHELHRKSCSGFCSVSRGSGASNIAAGFRSGEETQLLTVKTSEGDFTVTINSDTKIQHAVGLTGMRKKQDTPDVLIPGLKMSFEGAAGSQENQVDAKAITFDSDDLALAEVIQAGSEKEIIR